MINKILIIASTLFLFSCANEENGLQYSDEYIVIFEQDPNDKDVPFEPSISEVKEAEAAFITYLKNRKDTLNYPIFQKHIPEEERLIYYKRRFFGRVNIENQKVIKVEFIMNRCMNNKDRNSYNWKRVDYIRKMMNKESQRTCWFSFQYNIDQKLVYGL